MALGLAAWLAPGATARAQRLAREYPVAPLRITEQGGEVGFEYDYFGEKQKLSDGSSASTRFTNQSFQEYLLYRLRGYAYHPRFLEFDTRVKLGFLQQQITREGVDSDYDGFKGGSSNTFLNGYDIYLRFFKDHPLSLSLSANRDHTAVMELFTDRILLDSQGMGAVLNWKKGPFPMDLSYNEYR
ncbi:MAG: hypothetical protein M1457_05650, partial [bacterium]|nr:hypothetical protein [bacterium]